MTIPPILGLSGGAGGGGGNQQDAYDAGAGIVIDNTQGSMTIDASALSVTYAPLTLVPRTTAPSTVADGAVMYFKSFNQFTVYDSVRGFNLTDSSVPFSFTSDTSINGALASPIAGKPCLHNAVLYAITARGVGNNTKEIEVLSNGSAALSFNLVGGVYSNNALNNTFSAGAYVTVNIVDNADAALDSVNVDLYFRWAAL